MSKKLINIRIDEDLKKQVGKKLIDMETNLTEIITNFLKNFVK